MVAEAWTRTKHASVEATVALLRTSTVPPFGLLLAVISFTLKFSSLFAGSEFVEVHARYPE